MARSADPEPARASTPAEPAERAAPGKRLGTLVLIHVSVMAVGATWAYGGNTPWAGFALSAWGSLGVLLTLRGVFAARTPDSAYPSPPLAWLWPLGVFDVLVLASLFNPNFRALADGARTVFVEIPGPLRWPGWPSTARPDVSARALWFFNAAYLTAFNLLVLRRRRQLRAFFAVLACNALALAVYGTFQKLAGATAVFFAAKRAVQPYFFASFLYRNHWGAFALLMVGIALALCLHHLRRDSRRSGRHSPIAFAVVGCGFIAATVPLSGSRAGTVLCLGLIVLALLQAVLRSVRSRQVHGEPIHAPVMIAAAASIAAVGFTAELGQDVIQQRIALTREQFERWGVNDGGVTRETLYRDTFRLAGERLWFGWGMGSYPTAFYRRNTQHHSPVDGLPHYFEDAHSDWLQSLAEVGAVGTVLLLLSALGPLSASRGNFVAHPMALYPLIACVLVALYAAVEFPFGNRAVVVSFWSCWFGAIQYSRLSRTKSNREDTCSPS